MALAPIGGRILDIGSEWFQPRDVVVGGGASDFSANMVQARADSSGNDTLNIFLSNPDKGYEFAASVVQACESKTVLALQCTQGPDDSTNSFDGIAAIGCGKDTPPVTVTEKPDQFYLSTTTSTAGGEVTIIEDCKLDGTTGANCAVTFALSLSGTSTATTTSTELPSGTAYRREVSITGGAEKLAQATGKCNSAAPAISARAVALWGLVASFGVVLTL